MFDFLAVIVDCVRGAKTISDEENEHRRPLIFWFLLALALVGLGAFLWWQLS